MLGTHWTTIDNSIPFDGELLANLTIMDPDRLFDQLLHPPEQPGISTLVLCNLADLDLRPGSETPEVFARAKLASLRQPLRRTALRILMQHPGIFTTTFINDKPVEGCLIGITPFTLPNGRQYVIELGRGEDQPLFRFRRSDNVEWSGDELWAFER